MFLFPAYFVGVLILSFYQLGHDMEPYLNKKKIVVFYLLRFINFSDRIGRMLGATLICIGGVCSIGFLLGAILWIVTYMGILHLSTLITSLVFDTEKQTT